MSREISTDTGNTIRVENFYVFFFPQCKDIPFLPLLKDILILTIYV